MYKVKNKTKDTRRFRDKHTGRDVLVPPMGYITTMYPPIANPIWEISNIEKKEKKKELNLKEDKQWQQ